MMTIPTRLIHGASACLMLASLGFATAWGQQPGPPVQDGIQPLSVPPLAVPAGAPPVMPAQQGRPLDNQPAAAPFILTPEQQAYVDQVLVAWENHTSKIKTFSCQFTRWEYQPGFIPEGHPHLKDKPALQCEGDLKYSAPDKGSFKVTEMRRLNLQNGNYEIAKDGEGKTEIGEHWVSTGEAIYEYDAKQKVVIKRPIPPEHRGKAITDGPLPFLFGAEAEKLKRRYFLRIITPVEFAQKEIWVDAWPRFRGDAANFKRSVLRLNRATFEPMSMRMYDPADNPTSYEFRSVTVNDPLAKVKELFAPPKVPWMWKLQVEDYSAQPQQPAMPQAARPGEFR